MTGEGGQSTYKAGILISKEATHSLWLLKALKMSAAPVSSVVDSSSLPAAPVVLPSAASVSVSPAVQKVLDAILALPEDNPLLQKLRDKLGITHLSISVAELEARPVSVTKSTGSVTSGAGRGRPKKEVAPPPPMPEAGEDAPDPSEYRLAEEDIRTDVCLGRVFPKGSGDKRWSIEILKESQCGAELCEDGEGDLCKLCYTRSQRYAIAPKAGSWHGRVTEDPLPWMHMLGTSWADAKMAEGKLKWLPGSVTPAGGAGESSAASVSSAESASTGTKMTVADLRAAAKAEKDKKKEAEKAAKEAEKAALKAAKEAEKEALKAAKEAEKAALKEKKEAEKAALKEAKEAEKAAEKAAKEAAKASKPAPAPKKAASTVTKKPTASAAAAAPAPAKADTSASVSSTVGEVIFLDGDMVMNRGGYIYAYDAVTERVGDYIGKLLGDGETIDKTVPEPGKAAAPPVRKGPASALLTPPPAPAAPEEEELDFGDDAEEVPPAE